MPPSGFNKEAVDGLLQFVRECYKDIQAEVESGKHPTTQAAVDYEIDLIGKAMMKLHIDPQGNLVDRSIRESG